MWDAGKKNKGGPRQRRSWRSYSSVVNGGGITYFFAVAGTRIFFVFLQETSIHYKGGLHGKLIGLAGRSCFPAV